MQSFNHLSLSRADAKIMVVRGDLLKFQVINFKRLEEDRDTIGCFDSTSHANNTSMSYKANFLHIILRLIKIFKVPRQYFSTF